MRYYLSKIHFFFLGSCLSLLYLSSVYSIENTLDVVNTTDAFHDNRVPLADGFFNVSLGFTFDEVVETLKKESLLQILEEPEIFVVPEKKQRILRAEGVIDDSTGYQFIKEAYFQFNEDDVLIILTISLNTKIVDYFTIFDIHDKKYGSASSIDPNKAQWNSEDITLVIERPLTIKYIMNSFINLELRQNGNIYQQNREKYREEFLSLF